HRLDAVPDHRHLRRSQLPHLPAHRVDGGTRHQETDREEARTTPGGQGGGRTRTRRSSRGGKAMSQATDIRNSTTAGGNSGKGTKSAKPAKAREPRRKALGIDRRPGFLTYGLLLAVFIGGAYPLWWSFVAGSSDSTVLTATWPPLLPGGQFWTNVGAVLDTVPFWQALGNSIIVSTVITVSVVAFSTLAGYAFAKLRFRGREGLLVFVIGTLAVPTQLGIIPLFMVMKQFGWTGTLGAVIVPTL